MIRWLFLTAPALALGLAMWLSLSQGLGSAPALRIEEDLTGRIIACDVASYTITSGSGIFLFHEGVKPSGNFSGIAMFTPRDIVATDGTDSFFVRGAGTGSAAANGSTGGVVQTFISMLQIVDQGGGVVASVQLLAHVSPNDKTVEFDFGECASPV